MVIKNGSIVFSGTMQMTTRDKRVFLPYAIWHNQKTGKFTIRTESGFHSIPEADVMDIKLLQTKFPFPD